MFFRLLILFVWGNRREQSFLTRVGYFHASVPLHLTVGELAGVHLPIGPFQLSGPVHFGVVPAAPIPRVFCKAAFRKGMSRGADRGRLVGAWYVESRLDGVLDSLEPFGFLFWIVCVQYLIKTSL